MSRVYYEIHTTYQTEAQAKKAAEKEASAFTKYGDTVLETWIEPRKYETTAYESTGERVTYTVTGYKAVILYTPCD